MQKLRSVFKRWISTIESSNVSLKNVNLVGINRVVNPKFGSIRRFIWMSILIAGAIYAVCNSSLYIKNYLKKAVKVEVTTIMEEKFELPVITMCIKDKYDFNSLLALWYKAGYKGKMPSDADLILLSNYSLEEIWLNAGIQLDNVIDACYVGPGTFCLQDFGKWKKTFTRYGLCHTFYDSFTISSGNYFGFYLRLTYRKHPYGLPFSGFLFGFHSLEDSADYFIQNGFQCSIRFKKFGCYAMITYTFQENVNLDRPNFPCNVTSNYSRSSCRLNCLHNFIASHADCRLPHMNVGYELCRTRTQVEYIYELIDKYEENGEFYRREEDCSCLLPCHHKNFYWDADTTWRADSRAVIKVFSNDQSHKWTREKYVYKGGSLAADIGGIFGLMLAASILTLIQFVEVLGVKLISAIRKRFLKN